MNRRDLLKLWCEEEGIEVIVKSRAFYFKHFRLSAVSLICLPCCYRRDNSVHSVGRVGLWFIKEAHWSDPSFFEELKSYFKKHENHLSGRKYE